MDYGQLVIVHMALAPSRRPPLGKGEDRYYRSHGIGLPRARRPHLRLDRIVARLRRSLLQPLARVHTP